MTPPVIPVAVWLLAAFDPILISIAVFLGWKADQFGKLFIATIAALGGAVLVSWAITAIGLPWIAPVGGDNPTLLPVRTVAAFLWSAAGYGAHRFMQR